MNDEMKLLPEKMASHAKISLTVVEFTALKEKKIPCSGKDY